MNRLVLIGNGFDLAHGLKTSYADFIDWYWDYRMHGFTATMGLRAKESKDALCSFKILYGDETWSTFAFEHSYFQSFPALGKTYKGKDVIKSIINDKEHFETTFYPLLAKIMQGVGDKYWSGIERDYYDLLKQFALDEKDATKVEELNQQLHFLQELLIKYLKSEEEKSITKNQHIWDEIYAPINASEISATAKKYWNVHLANGYNSNSERLQEKLNRYGLSRACLKEISKFKEIHRRDLFWDDSPQLLRLPEKIMLVNFNYTSTPVEYLNSNVAELVYIHGKLDEPASVIFGYGDEVDVSYKKLQDLNYHECMRNIKSMRYPQAPNYKKVLEFMESAPFQVYVMGHSCGLSDRTLLSKIFRHKLCTSIKPYFYINPKTGEDDYNRLIPNISRHLANMADRVVNRNQCTTLKGD